MDMASHAFIGATVGELSAQDEKGKALWPAVFAMAPDFLCMAVAYPFVGWSHGRSLYIPHHSDWSGVRVDHPWIAATWELPHSFWFVLLIVVPLVWYFKLPKMCVPAYCTHLLTDIAAHTGEWSVAPLWPLAWRVEGWSDPWRWPAWGWLVSAAVTCGMWLTFRYGLRYWRGRGART